MTETVHLWQAWGWTCDNCGLDNFERGITAEMTPEDRRETAEFNNVDPEDMEGEFVLCPEEVTCKHCGADFITDNE